VLPPVRFLKPVVRPGVPFVSFEDPRASVFAGDTAPDAPDDNSTPVEPASAGR
jgi:hypothetical protein